LQKSLEKFSIAESVDAIFQDFISKPCRQNLFQNLVDKLHFKTLYKTSLKNHEQFDKQGNIHLVEL